MNEYLIHRAMIIPLICANVIWDRFDWWSLNGRWIGPCLFIVLCWTLIKLIVAPIEE